MIKIGLFHLVKQPCTPYPRRKFLRYLVHHHPVLLHGANRSDLCTLEPRRQSDFNGRILTTVFASGDGLWSLFFATLDLAGYRGSLCNGCFVVTIPPNVDFSFLENVTAHRESESIYVSWLIFKHRLRTHPTSTPYPNHSTRKRPCTMISVPITIAL